LTFAVMDVHEQHLRDMGFALREPTLGATLVLWRDFRGLYFGPMLDATAFHLGALPPEDPAP
jgi:hypothetical protein